MALSRTCLALSFTLSALALTPLLVLRISVCAAAAALLFMATSRFRERGGSSRVPFLWGRAVCPLCAKCGHTEQCMMGGDACALVGGLNTKPRRLDAVP